MGLDTSHDCWHGPYSSFGQWRTALAEHLDVPIAQTRWGSDYADPEGDWQPRNYQGWWDETPDDIMLVLFVHSDCDGYIFPKEAEPLADALDKIRTGDEYIDSRTEQFAAGLRRAADRWEVVVFS